MAEPRVKSRTQVALIVGVYAIVFWGLLPLGLWAVGVGLDRLWALPPLRAPVLGGLLTGLGLGLVLWTFATLWREAGGLPITALPPPRLATHGPYRLVRHPNYLGFNLAVVGAGLIVGSRGLALVVTPALGVAWTVYAMVEERSLRRRFKDAYRMYSRDVGRWPRLPIYTAVRTLVRLGLMKVRVEGAEHIPRSGPAILIANHACYSDPLGLLAVTRRRIRFLTTAEAYRRPLIRWFLARMGTLTVRRYRLDVVACREALRVLEGGELIGMFPEGEREPLGGLQQPLASAVHLLTRAPAPVIPIGISGSYNAGPRWSEVLRRRPVTLRIGPPIDLKAARSPTAAVMDALAGLIETNPAPVDLEGLEVAKLCKVVWACPECRQGPPTWEAATLHCEACGASWRATRDGRFETKRGETVALAELAHPLWDAPEKGPIEGTATGWSDVAFHGLATPPLQPLGEGRLVAGTDGVHFGELFIPIADICRVTTERADTLQVATSCGMWQWRPDEVSVFRLRHRIEQWRQSRSQSGSRT